VEFSVQLLQPCTDITIRPSGTAPLSRPHPSSAGRVCERGGRCRSGRLVPVPTHRGTPTANWWRRSRPTPCPTEPTADGASPASSASATVRRPRPRHCSTTPCGAARVTFGSSRTAVSSVRCSRPSPLWKRLPRMLRSVAVMSADAWPGGSPPSASATHSARGRRWRSSPEGSRAPPGSWANCFHSCSTGCRSPPIPIWACSVSDLVVRSHQRTLVVTTFRESFEAARRLCLVLGSSRVMAEADRAKPRADRRPRRRSRARPAPRAELVKDAIERLNRPGDEGAVGPVWSGSPRIRRCASPPRDLLDVDDIASTGTALTNVAEVVLRSGRGLRLPRHCLLCRGHGPARRGRDVLCQRPRRPSRLRRPRPRRRRPGEQAAEALLRFIHGPSPSQRVATVDLGLRLKGARAGRRATCSATRPISSAGPRPGSARPARRAS